MSEKQQLKQLIKKRATVKGKLTNFGTYLKSLKGSETDPITVQIELQLRLEKIESLYDDFDTFQTEIEELSDVIEEECKERQSFEMLYYSLVSSGRSLIASHRKLSLPSHDTVGGTESEDPPESHKRKVVKLPKIDLPTFHGDYHSWLGFKDTFNSLINSDESIDSISKFHYLRASLKDNAASTISGLDFCADNYQSAWKILCDRYDNKRLLENHHLNSLLKINSLQKESSTDIRNLVDTINKNIRALANLGHPVQHWDILIIHIMSCKLDSVTSREWETHRNELKDSPTLENFLKFLSDRANVLETLDTTKQDNTKHDNPKQMVNNKSKSLVASTSQSKSNLCPLCNQEHFLFKCESFRLLPVENRIQKATELQVCLKCLRFGHSTNKCRFPNCNYCFKKHSTLLHLEQIAAPSGTENVTLSAGALHNPSSSISTVLLSTALVKVLDSNGQPRTAKILLDNGSTANFITEDLCAKLNLKTVPTSNKVTGINSQALKSTNTCSLTFESFVGGFKRSIDCIVLSSITTPQPSTYINLENIQMPSGICLADPTFHIPSTIDILVGADIFWGVIGNNRICLGKNKPTLCETQLGWLVSGTVWTNKKDDKVCMLIKNLDFDLSRFWELESISPKYDLTPEEQACEEHFKNTTKRKSDGRFIVSLPLKESPEVLGDSFQMAKSRFLSLERKLARDSSMRQLYVDFMKEYKALGHMTEQRSQYNKSCYLPHHGVVRESSTTTKLRVVFDASAVTTSQKSLNHILRVGPTVQDDLMSILLRFRQHKYVVSADIEKMYRQTEIFEEERALQQILWRFDPSHPLKTYQLNTVTYGTASAPYLATRCLLQLSQETSDPSVKRAIRHDFYVDDFLSGNTTIDETISLCRGVINTLSSAQLNLRKWHSNNRDILLAISGETKVSGSVDLSNDNLSKTLGLNWDCSADTLLFSIDTISNASVNKRQILSTISQVFDPLGLVSPCIVEAKIIMQQLWVNKCDWENPIPAEIRQAWLEFTKLLPQLNSLAIPRYVSSNAPVDIQLHIFSDASEKAYGTCLYIRSLDSDGAIMTHLVAAKSKVAPLKTMSIPRLELSSVLLGVRLGTKVLNALTLRFNKCILWSDSTIVLGWLNSPSNNLKPFVRHRVSEIQDCFSSHELRYVPSKENPADLVSRGLKADVLGKSDLWWSGPPFLKFDPTTWPDNPNAVKISDLPETIIRCFHTTNEPNLFSGLINKISSLPKLQRVTAFILRFVKNCRDNSNKLSGDLTPSEIHNANNFLLKIAQCDSFPEERESLLLNQKLPHKNRLLNLSPFIDEHGLIRVGGRLANTNYEYNTKHPILLSSKHSLCKLIFDNFHIKYLHAGPQLLLATIRHNYWPLGGTNLAKLTVRSCIKCCRLKGNTIQPIMGNLPEQRAQLEFPFFDTGVDYAGPIMIATRKGRGCRPIKSYICVFVCLATKAIHLELVSDMTKEAFIAALNRFTARRGKPNVIYSDNGSSLVGTFNELSKILSQFSSADMIQEGLKFSFIPAYTPHFGGLWEAAVKSVKHHLRRVLGLSYLDYEEMNTLLIQIEAILNSRPITPMSNDPSDLSPLTPAHFLIGRSLLFPPQVQITCSKISSLARFQRIELLKQHFWGRFSHEYITNLQQRTKWFQYKDSLKKGTLVLIKDKNTPPLMWLLGRILNILPGRDGVARVADIKTKKGVVRRAFNNICPLPHFEDTSTRGVC